MNYMGPGYFTDIDTFTWNGSEYIYDGSDAEAILTWDESINPKLSTDKVTVSIRLDATLSTPLMVYEKDGTDYGMLYVGSPAGTYEVEVPCSSGTFGGLKCAYGYTPYSVVGIDVTVIVNNFYDIMDISNFIANLSGETTDSYAPYSNIYNLDTYLFDSWGFSGYAINISPAYWGSVESYGGRMLFRLKQPVPMTRLRIRGDGGSLAVSLVSPDGSRLNLYNYAYGDVLSTSNVAESVMVEYYERSEFTTTWDFPEKLVECFVIGSGAAGYPQEYINAITGMWIEPPITSNPLFWTNFMGQFETE